MTKLLTIVAVISVALFAWMSFSISITHIGKALEDMTPSCQTFCLQSALEQSNVSIVATEMIVIGFAFAVVFFFHIIADRPAPRAIAVRAGPDPFRLRGIIKRE